MEHKDQHNLDTEYSKDQRNLDMSGCSKGQLDRLDKDQRNLDMAEYSKDQRSLDISGTQLGYSKDQLDKLDKDQRNLGILVGTGYSKDQLGKLDMACRLDIQDNTRQCRLDMLLCMVHRRHRSSMALHWSHSLGMECTHMDMGEEERLARFHRMLDQGNTRHRPHHIR